MSTLTSLFDQAPVSGSSRYVRLLDITPAVGPYGRYVRLLCEEDDGSTFEATADETQFPYLEPYYNLLRQSRQSEAVEGPVVPVFLDLSNTWRFSWLSARKDYPEVISPTIQPPEDDRPFRLQITVSRSLASAFDQAAAARGFSRGDYLLHLVRSSLT